MTAVFGMTGIVNWVVYTWLPLYLYERFNMSLAEAGFTSGFYFQVAGFAGMYQHGWQRSLRDDCNTMPALCQITRPELRSTGYGVRTTRGRRKRTASRSTRRPSRPRCRPG